MNMSNLSYVRFEKNHYSFFFVTKSMGHFNQGKGLKKKKENSQISVSLYSLLINGGHIS